MEALRDLRHAVRQLRRSPGFAAVVVATLGLGIGAVAAAFTVVDQVILEPLPVRDQERLVVAWNVHTVRNVPHWPFFRESYELVREGASSLESVAATFTVGTFETLARLGESEEEVLRQSWLVGDLFDVLGVRPAAGRLPVPTDEATGVAAISWDLWTRGWGRSPNAVGATIVLADVPHEIVGVTPRDFDYPRGADIWVPYPGPENAILGEGYIEADLVARMRPGATQDLVAEQISALYSQQPANVYDGVVPIVTPFADVVLGDLRPTLFLLLGSAVVVLLIAGVNVASLVSVRAADREGSMAVRRAIGADRWRLAREALVEASWLGVIGGAVGAVLAVLTIRVLLPLAPAELPRLDLVRATDPLLFAVAGAATLGFVALVAGLTLLRTAAYDPSGRLRGAASGAAHGVRSRRSVVVVAQTALAVWCAAVGVLLARSLRNLEALETGFRVEDLVFVDLQMPYGFGELPEGFFDRFETVAARLEANPSIESVTFALVEPLIGNRAFVLAPRLEGQTQEQAGRENPMINWDVVEPSYFGTLALPILRGRALAPSDDSGSPPAVVVNEAAAQLLWPGEEAVGKQIGAFGDRTGAEWATVVGVAADARYLDFVETRPVVYFPFRQLRIFPPAHLMLRVRGASYDLLAGVRDAMVQADPAIKVKSASSLAARLRAPLARPRFAAVIVGMVALTTLLLGAVGVYGVMSASVRARSREVGVRMACGAAPGAVRGMILRQGGILAGIGSLLGALAVLPGSALLESLLFQVTPSDPWSLAAGVGLVLAAALAACWVPAVRAARTDPMLVLKGD